MTEKHQGQSRTYTDFLFLLYNLSLMHSSLPPESSCFFDIPVLSISDIYVHYNCMLITEEIEKLKRELDGVSDEDLLRTIHELIDFSKKVSGTERLRPMTGEELTRRAKESEQAIRDGRVTSIEDVERESSGW